MVVRHDFAMFVISNTDRSVEQVDNKDPATGVNTSHGIHKPEKFTSRKKA
jgi:hypothetical protein